MRMNKLNYNNNNVNKQILDIINPCKYVIKGLCYTKEPIIYKFENINNNLYSIFEPFEKKFNVKADDNLKLKLVENNSVKIIKKFTDKLTSKDNSTNLHPNHVGKAKSDIWKTDIPEKYLEFVNKKLGVYLEKLGYKL